MSAISTGIAYFHSNRSAIYAEITSSDAMIAMIALWAIVLPNVGPIEVEEKFFVPGTVALANLVSSALLISFTLSGRSVFVEIWKPLPPMLLLVNFCTSAFGYPAAAIA